MLALAEDHRNDIISNLGAIAFGATASISPTVWWFDPVGAILISAYIIWSWACILKGQVRSPHQPTTHCVPLIVMMRPCASNAVIQLAEMTGQCQSRGMPIALTFFERFINHSSLKSRLMSWPALHNRMLAWQHRVCPSGGQDSGQGGAHRIH